jgi:hypothetical protein
MIGLAGVMRSILTRLEVGRIGGERFRFLSSAWRENGMDKRACYPRFSLKTGAGLVHLQPKKRAGWKPAVLSGLQDRHVRSAGILPASFRSVAVEPYLLEAAVLTACAG